MVWLLQHVWKINGSVCPDNPIFFFQSNHRYWLSLRFTSINFVFIKEAKIIDYQSVKAL